jgi:hypothetical protein
MGVGRETETRVQVSVLSNSGTGQDADQYLRLCALYLQLGVTPSHGCVSTAKGTPLLSTRAVKPCGFSHRDIRCVPFKAAWEVG